MNTLDLGRYINTLDLGLPFGIEAAETEYGGRRSAANNALLRFISNAELEALQDRPDLLRSLALQEDDEVAEMIASMLSRGLL